MSDRERLAEHFETVGVSERRFIDVNDGEKGSDVTHSNPANRYDHPGDVGGNYGVYAGASPDGSKWLVDVDVDDYNGDVNEEGLRAILDLPDTLTVESPHTDGERGGHRYYVVEGENVGKRLTELVGKANPSPSWGELRAHNQYVVGPGSVLDGCNKEWCDTCALDDGGEYTISNDAPVATIDVDDLLSALEADGYKYGDDTDDTDAGEEYDGDEWLTDEAVRDALDHVDPDMDHTEWIAVVAAIYDYDGGSTGKRIAKEWSKSGSKWDKGAERSIESVWREGANNATVATLVHKAKEGGWTPTARGGSRQNGDTPEPAPTGDGLTWEHVRGVYDAEGKGVGRKCAADVLEAGDSWMYVMESEKLWVYDPDAGYFNSKGEEAATSTLEANLGTHYSTTEVKEILSRIEARNQTGRDRLNARNRSENLVCVGNGVLNVRTGELVDHDPEYRFIRGVDQDYDPDAVPERTLRFLRSVTKRDADMWTLIQQLGHGLLPGHPYKAFVVMFGPGDNGKTAVGRVFRRFVGDENAASVELADFDKDDFATSDIVGKMINVGDDLSGKKMTDVSMLKRLTGGDTLRANEKFKATFDFQNEAAMFFSGNEPPVFEEQTDAIKGRLYPIHMPYQYTQEPDDGKPDADPHLVDKIATDAEEMSGLLNLALQGAQELIESGGAFAMPEGPQERMEIYEAASDPVRRFVVDYLEQGGPDDVALKDDVYDVYAAMCRAEDERRANANFFKSEVSQQAIIDVESGRTLKVTDDNDQQRCWKYLRFNPDAADHMSQRLKQRYFNEEPPESDEADGPGVGSAEEKTAFGATPLTDAAASLTGYVTVTAEVVDVDTYGDGENATTKAVLKDESGAMDLVTWDDGMAPRLREHEGGAVVVENAEVGEHNGTRQLQPKDGLTEISEIAQGVGHTEASAPADENQQQVTEAATDGGDVPEDATGRVVHYIRNECGGGDTLTVASVAGSTGLAPDTAEEALNTIQATKNLLGPAPDGYQVL